jgi:hypothetical protein
MFTGVTSLYRKMEHENIKTLVVKHSGEASPIQFGCAMQILNHHHLFL